VEVSGGSVGPRTMLNHIVPDESGDDVQLLVAGGRRGTD
jgi:hypothetical protein